MPMSCVTSLIEVHTIVELAASIVLPIPDDAIVAGTLIAQNKGSNVLSGYIINS